MANNAVYIGVIVVQYTILTNAYIRRYNERIQRTGNDNSPLLLKKNLIPFSGYKNEEPRKNSFKKFPITVKNLEV